MAVNADKTKFIVFRTRGKVINPLDCQVVYDSNEIGMPVNPNLIYNIQRIHNEGDTKNFKLLGILFDEYLTFDAHINQLCSKISKSLFCLNRVKNFISADIRKLLYFAMIHSHIMYCLCIYSCANSTSLNPLRIKQKAAIRVIAKADYRAHTAPLFTQLKILPIDQLIALSTLKFMHSFTHNLLPFSFRGTWITNRERIPERELRNADQLYVPQHNYATLKRMPLFNFPSVWNNFGDPVKLNPRQYVFVRNVKNALRNDVT